MTRRIPFGVANRYIPARGPYLANVPLGTSRCLFRDSQGLRVASFLEEVSLTDFPQIIFAPNRTSDQLVGSIIFPLPFSLYCPRAIIGRPK